MQKILVIFVILSSFLHAAYNPFFNDEKIPAQPQTINKVITQQIISEPIPKRKNVNMTYFGFIESKKGKFALVSFNLQNIVIQKNDSLYFDEQIFKVQKITSNYIMFKDRYSRPQTVYFSSEMNRR
ncbi:hypothetical protein N9A28_07470 [Sulfurimonas sp.]|nr:hypothetical protein [Sulfurimonas sp.]